MDRKLEAQKICVETWIKGLRFSFGRDGFQSLPPTPGCPGGAQDEVVVKLSLLLTPPPPSFRE